MRLQGGKLPDPVVCPHWTWRPGGENPLPGEPEPKYLAIWRLLAAPGQERGLAEPLLCQFWKAPKLTLEEPPLPDERALAAPEMPGALVYL